jgi:hypothetical protein
MSERPRLLPSIQWPPISTDGTLPRYVVWRDRLMTIVAWMLLLALASDLFYLVVTHALQLLGHSQTGPDAQWALWWDRLRPFVQVIVLMAAWLTLWGFISLRRARDHR